MLAYSVLAEDNDVKFDELILVSSKMDNIINRTIAKFHLPIRYLVITRKFIAEIK